MEASIVLYHDCYIECPGIEVTCCMYALFLAPALPWYVVDTITAIRYPQKPIGYK